MIFIIILHIKNGNQYSQNDLGVRKLDKKCTFHVIGVLVIKAQKMNVMGQLTSEL